MAHLFESLLLSVLSKIFWWLVERAWAAKPLESKLDCVICDANLEEYESWFTRYHVRLCGDCHRGIDKLFSVRKSSV